MQGIKKSSSKNNISAKHWNDYENFVELQMNCFDINATEDRTLYQQKLWGVNKKFFEKQRLVPHVGYCSTFVD